MTLIFHGKSRKRQAVLIAAALLTTALAVAGALATASNPTEATSENTCDYHGYVDKIDWTDPNTAQTHNAPAGQVIADVCIKSGEGAFYTPAGEEQPNEAIAFPDDTQMGLRHITFDDNYGPFVADSPYDYAECFDVEGLGTASVTVSEINSSEPYCKGVSHTAVKYEEIPGGEITIEKVAAGAGDQTFEFTVSPAGDEPDPNPFTLADGQDKEWYSQAGDYTVTETGMPVGWDLDSIVCRDAAGAPLPDGGGKITLVTDGVTIHLADDDDITCTFTNVAEDVTVKAHKIICPTEDLLPDWADGSGRPITSGTASSFLAANSSCELAEGWAFEYQWDGSNPGDNNAATALADFDTTTGGTIGTPAELTIPIQEGKTLWVREQKPADYIDFYGQNHTTPKVSAEMYCSADVYNYDNWERIEDTNGQSDLTPGTTYWCVAFNVEEKRDGFVEIHKVVTNVDDDPTPFDFSYPNPATDFDVVEGTPVTRPISAGAQVVTEAPEPGYTTLGWARIFPPNACPVEMPTSNAFPVITFGTDNTAELDVDGITYVLCFYNKLNTGNIVVHKVNIGGDPADEFTIDVAGDPSDSKDGLTPSNPLTFTLPPDDYTVTEQAKAGYEIVGYGLWVDNECVGPGAAAPGPLLPNGIDVSLAAGETEHVCVVNQAVGTVVLIKNETVQSAAAQTWNFAAGVLGNPALTTAANNTAPPAQTSDSDTFSDVPVGTYSISEVQGADQCVTGAPSTAYQTNALAAIGSIPNPDPAANKVGSGSINFTVAKGQTTYIVFENQGCGTVLAAANIIVRKFSTVDASMTTPADDALLAGWTITLTGTGGAAAGFGPVSVPTNASGLAAFLGVPDGTYTVSETLQGAWTAVGSKGDDGLGQVAGTSRAGVTVGLDQTRNIDFYNRTPATVIVHKTVDDQVGVPPRNVAGWQINLAGCGTSINKVTDPSGTAVFSNLMPAISCAYTVTETDPEGFAVSYSPSQVVAPGPGETATVNVLNTRTRIIILETPTPTSTPVTPTATPTEEQPTPTETVAGEKTPGLTPGVKDTPIPPVTGTGTRGGGSAGSIGLVLLGLAAVTGGMLFLSLARREKGEGRREKPGR